MTKKKSKKKKTKTKERSEKDPRRLADGQFTAGNEIGKETRFKSGHESPKQFTIGNTVPLKYDDVYIDYLYEYYDGGYSAIGSVFPTKSGFPRWLRKVKNIHISQSTIELWTRGGAEYAQRFKEAYDELHAEAEDLLHNGALSRRFDSGYSKLLASAVYGLREKTESKQEIDGDIGLNVKISYFEGEEDK